MHIAILRIAVFLILVGAPLRALAAPPSATTSPATSLTTSSAVLNGTGTPAGEASTGWYRYSTTSPGTCNDSFGTRVPSAGGTDLGSGAVAVPYAITTTGLTSGVTYYFCAIVSNASGTAFGNVLSFTIPGAPVAATTGASGITSTAATLGGSANPVAASTTGWFRYSTTSPGTCNDTFGTRAPVSGGSALGSGTSVVAYTQGISGLTPGATYYYCAIASNAHGTSYGALDSFTVLPAVPSVATSAATLLTGTTAQLNGSGNPGGAATTGWFRYATASPGSCNDSFGARAPASGGTALGAGNTSVPFSVGVTGLSPGTTYYYCAIAQNSAGTGFGAVQQFTTPLPPTVTTTAATLVTNVGARLNGTANPNGATTTGWFRYSATAPGTCNDTFGSRAPVSGGTNVGGGGSPVAYFQSITGLSAGTTYYFCAIASSAEGLSFGQVLSFTTLAAPTVTTQPATTVLATSAVLNGTANPNGATSTGWYRYATTNPGTCNDTFGTRLPTSGGSALGAGTSATAYAFTASGLLPNTTYYFCAIASNAYGTSFGAPLSFTTAAAAPTAVTSAATLLTGSTAQLNGSGNPGGSATTGWFRYATTSPGTCNDSFGTRAPASGGSALGSGTSSVAFSQGITGLASGTLYYFCAITQNAVGTAFGAVQQFTTPLPPTVTTTAATLVTNVGARLNGTANPHGATTTGWFRYATTSPGTCDDSFGSRAPVSGGTNVGGGSSPVAYFQNITGLSPGTTYYFCAIASSAEGLSFGQVLSFTTLAAPTVTTQPATTVLATSAVLNGSANPNGATSTGWYRYATTNPGTCNDTFGTRLPTSGGSALGAGTSATAYAFTASGLLPNTTYYFCAIASNSYGTSFGAPLSFTTAAAAPTAVTSAATLLTGTTAQLNGSGNPGGSATTGWFRYATASPGTCNDSFGTRAPASGGSALGSGTSSAAFSQGITGLTPGTLYFFCAITQNAVGTAFGAVQQFTTPLPPTVVTLAATAVANTSATLNGTGNPHGAATTGWYRYATTSPGTCDDTFGSRAPVTGGTSLGAGNSPVSFPRSVTGLSPGTTYYFCAIASSAEGLSFGQVLSFTTLAAPTVTTQPASNVLATSAVLNGSANPNGATSTGWYRYATTNPVTCNDTFGTRLPTSGGSALGAGTSAAPYAFTASGLLPNTTYYFCAIASNAYGTSFGTPLSFTTAQAAPTAVTTAASSLTPTTAQLNGSSNPGGAATTGWFRYATTSPGTCNDSFGTRAPASGGSALGSGTSSVAFSQGITGLAPGTLYYFCAITQNSVGTAFGAVLSFTTTSPPTVSTLAATPVTAFTATLNGSTNPHGFASTGWFRYSTTSPGTCNDSFGIRAPASGGTALGSGNIAVGHSQPITGLTPGTTYYFCAIASSAIGTGFGQVLSFTTPASQPVVTTVSVTDVSGTSATLNGSANPHSSATTGWFRYSTANPGTCNDTFGTRAPVTGGTALGSGSTPVAYATTVSGLTTGVTYYFCAIAENSVGVGFGAVLSFNTAAPSVTTQPATAVSSTGATLNGSGNPNGTASTGWFRYSATNPGTCNDTFGTRAPATGGTALGAGSVAVAYAQTLSGLASSTTYYYCAIASSAAGLGYGAVLSFTTTGAPTVVTQPATAVSSTGATLNGSANPNLSATTGWFRYATTSPGTCNDTFGTRAPSSGGAALGAGSAPVDYSQTVTGLSAGATYYYCAVASNALGVRFGAVLSFTTPAAPTVTTLAATGVSSSGATLNGSANPRLSDATGWFRYATTSPGACNDTFGIRVPAGGGTALGAGSSAVPYSEPLTSLTAGTTYYYCAIASNAVGTSFGAVLSFTTPAAPVVVTQPATVVSSNGATLNGSANPSGTASTGWFRYATTNPGTCNDTFGTRAPAAGGTALGSGSAAVAYSQALTGLTAGATYYYCALASNATGTGFGAVLSFTTPAAPSVTTEAASAVAGTSATLEGAANPNGSATTGWFRYATTNPGTCNDTFGTRAPTSGGSALGSGSTLTGYSQPVTGLTQNTTYYYCAIASNAVGTSFGAVLSFTTLGPPVVVTAPATLVTPSTATLNGSANPSGATTTGWFRYATTSPGTCNDTFGTRAPTSGGAALGSGASAVAYSQDISGLTPGTTYYYCAIASSSGGTSFGAVLSFDTVAAPAVVTLAATQITSTGATLQGSGNPNLATASGWFRYATSSPGTCNDSFGIRAPASGGTPLGAGSSAVPFDQALTGLAQGTTYYYCAIAQNAQGLGVGDVMSFTTPSVPVVTTEAATGVTNTAATLEGTANPSAGASTGWFRIASTSPGACNDSFGTRVPATGGTALGDGTAPVPFAEMASGLVPGGTYYYCAIAQNVVGTAFGAVLSFTTPETPEPPVVVTEAATAVTNTGGTLQGTANPNLTATTGWFRYSSTDPGACDDTFGTRTPATGGTALGAGSTPVAYGEAITGLQPGTVYYYCAIASSAVGTGFGDVLSFTTSALAPSVTTDAPSDVTVSSATLNGTAVANGADTGGWFRYSATDPGACDDSFGVRVPATGDVPLGAGTTSVPFSEAIAGLTTQVYYYCAIAENAEGIAFGNVVSFSPGTTPPTVTTEPATGIEATQALAAGTANPNGLDAEGWFRVGQTNPGTCSDAFGQRVPAVGGIALGAGTAAMAFTELLTALEPSATYYFCAAASNLGGAAFGQVQTFTTEAAPPVVQTVAADREADGSLTLSGSADPRGSETTAWFRYDVTSPGTCNDTFGTRLPVADGQALGDGRSPVSFFESVAAPAPGTYYVCAIASNEAGLAYGNVLSVVVEAAPKAGGATGDDGGCGCLTVPKPSRGGLFLALLALLVLGGRRISRRDRV
ncbi:MAG: hypothetical protein KF718_33005 [Polyangiaceae bacterium]|nr:hypothetical protein [Polyangiaceae bacterium]